MIDDLAKGRTWAETCVLSLGVENDRLHGCARPWAMHADTLCVQMMWAKEGAELPNPSRSRGSPPQWIFVSADGRHIAKPTGRTPWSWHSTARMFKLVLSLV